jgi:hypothetical protein
VCSLSKFFHLACRKRSDTGGNFKEAQSGIIDLPRRKIETNSTESEDFKWDADAEDPRCVKLMIHYFYHLDYLEDETAKLKKQKRANEDFEKAHILNTGILIDHANMYAMGDKYGIPGLKALAQKKTQRPTSIPALDSPIPSLSPTPVPLIATWVCATSLSIS